MITCSESSVSDAYVSKWRRLGSCMRIHWNIWNGCNQMLYFIHSLVSNSQLPSTKIERIEYLLIKNNVDLRALKLFVIEMIRKISWQGFLIFTSGVSITKFPSLIHCTVLWFYCSYVLRSTNFFIVKPSNWPPTNLEFFILFWIKE